MGIPRDQEVLLWSLPAAVAAWVRSAWALPGVCIQYRCEKDYEGMCSTGNDCDAEDSGRSIQLSCSRFQEGDHTGADDSMAQSAGRGGGGLGATQHSADSCY